MKTTIKFKRYINNNPSQVKQIDIYSNGSKHWWLNGKRHRFDGPAIEYIDGVKHWFLDGRRHREDGPALTYSNGYKEWWLNNNSFSEKEHREALKEYKR